MDDFICMCVDTYAGVHKNINTKNQWNFGIF